jgi:uroporphyrinogen-III decarboxylase
MTTPPVLTPFEAARFNLDSTIFGMMESLTVDAAVNAAFLEERQMSELGHGVPPLSESVNIHMMWHRITELSIPGEH